MTSWQKKIRLYSGLILFVFAFGHLANHALGLVSIEAMESMRVFRLAIWRSLPGSILLIGALVLHVFFVLKKFVQRRSWRMGRWEVVQLVFGLCIPILLIGHILGTRMKYEVFGVDDTYASVLSVMWPGGAISQIALVILVWVHGCIGLHFLFQLKSWYLRCSWLLYSVAILLPVLSIAGFTVAGRQIYAQGGEQQPLTTEQLEFVYSTGDVAKWSFAAMVAAVLAIRIFRSVRDWLGPTIKIHYADGRTVTNQVGPTLLEISRIHRIAHASVCGGRARCSTCRVRILDGLDTLPEAGDAELKVLKRIGAGSNVRLACQLVPQSEITVATLLPAQRVAITDVATQDKYLWGVDQSVTILFADIRGFTALSEAKLPYDVVFVLNQYLGKMSDAIAGSGGYVDKFIGDGIMAIFGMDRSVEAGAREALNAAKAMSEVLVTLNKSLAADLDQPLKIGIGIHTGPAILGRIGVSGASGATQRITALGDTVNTASRLESACKTLACQLVVSQTTSDASELAIEGGAAELISVKGREEQVPIRAFISAMDMNVDTETKTALASGLAKHPVQSSD